MASLIRSIPRLICSSSRLSPPAWSAVSSSNAWHALGDGRRWASGSSGPGLLEMRTYQMDVNGAANYMKLCDEIAAIRMDLGIGYLGMFAKETGGDLNVVRHFYKFDDVGDRQKRRDAAAQNERWQEFLVNSKPFLLKQNSMIFVPCDDVMEVAGSPLIRDMLPATEPSPNPPEARGIYELRNYQLVPGYDTVPKLRQMFKDGLPSKIAADTHGRLVAFAASDVGILNNVIELWRYDSPEASIKAREASRKAQKWRECIAGVAPLTQTFTTEMLIPSPTSPWQ